MENTESKEKTSLRFSRADIIAFIALFVSLGALLVSVYEANILSAQQSIMQSQQKSSVLPYLVENVNMSINGEEGTYSYTLENKGIGPAKITSAVLSFNEKEIEDYFAFLEELKIIFPSGIDFGLSYHPPKDYFLSPKEKIKIIEFQFPEFSKDISILQKLKFNFEICYCSIYEDCWSIGKDKKSPKKGCE